MSRSPVGPSTPRTRLSDDGDTGVAGDDGERDGGLRAEQGGGGGLVVAPGRAGSGRVHERLGVLHGSDTAQNGVTGAVDVTVKPGETWTCTFNNSTNAGTIKVIKKVDNVQVVGGP